jgi:hypothetical protein
MKTLIAIFIIFMGSVTNPDDSVGVRECEGASKASIRPADTRKASGKAVKAILPQKKKEPLLLLRILTEL